MRSQFATMEQAHQEEKYRLKRIFQVVLYEMFVCVSTFDNDKNHHLLGRIVWPFKVPLAVICTGRCSSWYILWWYILYTSSRNTGQIAEVFVNAVQSSQQQKTVAHTKQSAPLKDDGSPRPPLQAARKLLPTPSSTPQLPARLMKPEIFEKQSYGMIQPMLPLNHVTLLHGRSKSRPLTQRLLHPACVCVRAYVCQCAVAVPNRSLSLSLSL